MHVKVGDVLELTFSVDRPVDTGFIDTWISDGILKPIDPEVVNSYFGSMTHDKWTICQIKKSDIRLQSPQDDGHRLFAQGKVQFRFTSLDDVLKSDGGWTTDFLQYCLGQAESYEIIQLGD